MAHLSLLRDRVELLLIGAGTLPTPGTNSALSKALSQLINAIRKPTSVMIFSIGWIAKRQLAWTSKVMR
jgi:hypothetical protein